MLGQLVEVVWVFTQLGLASFGGPAASIALMQQMLVQRLRWLSQQEYMDFVGASYLIPGPIAVQLSLHLGYRRAGLWGALAAVIGFVVPAAGITWVCAVIYVQNQGLPQLEACLQGVRPAILAIILVSLAQLGKGQFRGPVQGVILAGTVTAFLVGVNPFLVLIVAAAAGALLQRILPPWLGGTSPRKSDQVEEGTDRKRPGRLGLFMPLTWGWTVPTAASLAVRFRPWELYLLFAKVGLFLYGGGNVLAAYLSNDLVKTGILSRQQLLDALAVGQSTPGPILTVATFIGYILGGHLGSIAATLGIITPCVLLASLLHPYVRKARQYPWTASLLDALTLAVIGLILGVCLDLAREVFTQPIPVLWGLFCVIASWKLRITPVRLILASALVGLLIWG